MSRSLLGQRVARGALLVLLVLVALGALASCRGGPPARRESPLDKLPLKEPVIIVGDKTVSGAWLRNWCATQELQFVRSGVDATVDEYSLIKAGRQILTKMLLFANEAERRGLAVSDQEIQDQLSNEMKMFPSTQAWRERLEASGMTLEERREQIRLELLFNKYRDEVVQPEVRRTRANEEMAREYYTRFPDQFDRPAAVHLRHIMRSVAKDAPEGQREKEKANTEKARQRVLAGEKFEDVAREVSTDVSAIQGGDIKWVTEQAPLPEELKQKVLALSPGVMTEVLESAMGFHLFQAIEVRAAGRVPFEEAREGIEARLLDAAMRVAMENAAADLQKQTTIQHLDLTPYIGEPPPEAAAVPPRPAEAPARGSAPLAPVAPAAKD